MTTITTRAGKGAPLTNAELDANFTALNAGKLETSATTTDIAEGTNQYFTNARARAAISATGSLSYNSTTGVMSFTQGNSDTVTEGSTNLYYTDARARAAISSATGAAGYNSTTGVITIPSTTAHITEGSNLYYTDARVRAAISAGTGISYNSSTGAISSSITQYTDALARAAHSFAAGSGAYDSSTGVITIPTNTSHLTNGAGFITAAQTYYLGTTSIALNRSSASQSLTGVSIDGNAGTVTNGVYTTGDQSIGGVKTFTGTYLNVFNSGATYNGVIYLGNTRQLRQVASTSSWEMVNAANTTVIFTFDNSGNFTAAANVTAYSDERLKKDWAPAPADMVEALASVKSGTYTRIDTEQRQTGVSAQDLQKVLPEAVMENEDGILSVAYGNAALVAAIELAKEVRALKAEIAELKGK